MAQSAAVRAVHVCRGWRPERALRLHEWNAQLGSAFMHDLGHLELGLRNAYDRALERATIGTDVHGTDKESLAALFTERSTRSEVEKARALARALHGDATHARVVSCLTFGFWTHLAAADLEKSLWIPHLQHAWDFRTDRAKVNSALAALRAFRNKVAHHEPLLQGAENTRRQIVGLVRRLSPDAASHLNAHSTVSTLLAARP